MPSIACVKPSIWSPRLEDKPYRVTEARHWQKSAVKEEVVGFSVLKMKIESVVNYFRQIQFSF